MYCKVNMVTSYLLLMIILPMGSKYSKRRSTQIASRAMLKNKSFDQLNLYYISSSCRAASTDIPDPLSPLLPIIHRLWQVFRVTSRVLI